MTEHTITRLTRQAAQLSNLSYGAVIGEMRYQHVARARFAVMLVAREHGFSTPNIGLRLGGRDHTTVLSGLKKAEKLLAEGDAPFTALVKALREGVSDGV